MIRIFAHYGISTLLLLVYGKQVCPFLESLSIPQLSIPILLTMLFVLLFRIYYEKKIIDKSALLYQSRLGFKVDIGLYLLSGVFLTTYFFVVKDFPVSSGLKLLFALALLGFFIAIDVSLNKERKINRVVEETGKEIEPDTNYFSHPKKLAIFGGISIVFITGVFFLVINKDLDWLLNQTERVDPVFAKRVILVEVIFIGVVIILYLLNIIYSYARNFSNFLLKENRSLMNTTSGNFDLLVPISSNDEFGIMAKYTNKMVCALKENTEELQKTRDVTILSLASLAETRDNETGNHILRTQRYVKALAEEMATSDKYKSILDQNTIELLYKSAPLHDIGKVGIPDNILLKPGKLNDDEFKIMKKHAKLGSDALSVAEKELGSNSFLKYAKEIAISHHEKWDGSGYPKKLKGENIPLSGRIMSVADVYDALISKRVYKAAFSHEKAMSIITEWSNVNFDPDIVEIFKKIENKIIAIAKEHQD